MANNKYNESIEDKAFKALDEALQIDFSQQKAPSRSGKTPDAPEANVSENPSARNQQDQDDSQRRRGRSKAAEQQAPRAPAWGPTSNACSRSSGSPGRASPGPSCGSTRFGPISTGAATSPCSGWWPAGWRTAS